MTAAISVLFKKELVLDVRKVDVADSASVCSILIEGCDMCYCDLLGLCYSYQSGVSVQRSRRLLLCLVIFIAYSG